MISNNSVRKEATVEHEEFILSIDCKLEFARPCSETWVWSSSAAGALVLPGVSAQSGREPARGPWESRQPRRLRPLAQAKEARPAVRKSGSAQSLQEPKIK